jgi:hypothetical protein
VDRDLLLRDNQGLFRAFDTAGEFITVPAMGGKGGIGAREHANPWGSLRGRCGCSFVISRAEAAIMSAEGVLERSVQHGIVASFGVKQQSPLAGADR